jgi:hypothetical protein
VPLAAYYEAVAERPQMCDSNIEPSAAAGPGPSDPNEDEYLIARPPNTLNLRLQILKHLGAIAEEPDDVLASPHGTFADALVRDPFESGVGEFGERFSIPRVIAR